jgi:hypothetical protein
LGLKINNSRYIQDDSLIHWKGIAIPKEGSQEEPDEQAAPISSEYTGDNLKKLKKKSVEDVKGFTQNLSSYIAAGTTQLAYTQNP